MTDAPQAVWSVYPVQLAASACSARQTAVHATKVSPKAEDPKAEDFY
ncbi:MAG: hypothetical protein ACI89X_000877 [Planctomycetota bacterium]|jgi:hypothetical protein